MPNARGQNDVFDRLSSDTNPYANAELLKQLFRTSLGQQALPFFISAVDLAAGTAQDLVAPFDGTIVDLVATVQVAIGTGGDITVAVNGTDVTDCLVTFADSATKGTRTRATSGDFVPGTDTTNKVKKGDRITVTPDAAFASAGAVNGYVIIEPA